MNRRGKKPGYGNRGKTNCVFPPFSQPLLRLTNRNEKQPTKNKRRSFTQILDAANTAVLAIRYLLSEASKTDY
jgi:hypothetical protein